MNTKVGVIRRLVTYSPVEASHLDFEYGYWLGQGYQPRMGKEGVLVYETRAQDETLSPLSMWIEEIAADMKEIVNERPAIFYKQMAANKEASDCLLLELERMEWLHEALKELQLKAAKREAQ
jgi:hypothetical protein